MTIPSWLASSANPENISMMMKALAALAVLLGADAAVVSQLSSAVMDLGVKILEVISLAFAVSGGIRKIKFGRWSAPNYSNDI